MSFCVKMQVTAQEDRETVSDILGTDVSTYEPCLSNAASFFILHEILLHSFSCFLPRSHEETKISSDRPILQRGAKVRTSFHSFVLYEFFPKPSFQ